MTHESKNKVWIQRPLPNLQDTEHKYQNFKFLVFDRTPDYYADLFTDTITDQCRNETKVEILRESGIFSPLNFIRPPKYEQLMQHLGNRMQAYILGLYNDSSSKNEKKTNVLIESPVSTLSWLIFANKTDVISNRDLEISKDLIKLMLFEFQQPRINRIDYIHSMILTQYDTSALVPPSIHGQIDLFLKNYLTFRESAIEACKIANDSGIKIDILPNSKHLKN